MDHRAGSPHHLPSNEESSNDEAWPTDYQQDDQKLSTIKQYHDQNKRDHGLQRSRQEPVIRKTGQSSRRKQEMKAAPKPGK